MSSKFLIASNNPLDDIERVSYQGQPIERRMYKQGYEQFFENLPVLNDSDPLLSEKVAVSKTVMNFMAKALRQDSWTPTLKPLAGGFNRTILGMESPKIKEDGTFKEGNEIVLARWGDGHTSPVHGHKAGYLHEELLFGKIRVNTYRIVDNQNRIVRPLRTDIYDQPGTIASMYTNSSDTVRSALVHNFTSIGYSGTLHYLPEHTRDGRDNGYTVQYFESKINPLPEDFTQLNAQQGLEQLHIGDVALVRSENVPEYGNHWIVITGKPVLKEHGLRPQDFAIHAPTWTAKTILDCFEPIMGLTLLKLNDQWKERFHKFHQITVTNEYVV
jgi:hypothetical protein